MTISSIIACVVCAKPVRSRPSRPRRFCSQDCYHTWQSGQESGAGRFQKGHRSWLRGKKGIHCSPRTEFKPGHSLTQQFAIGTVTTRRSKKGTLRQYKKTSSGWTEYAKALWVEAYGCLLDGDVVHHLNGDKLDDRLENLIAIPRTEHPKFHSRWGLREISDNQREMYLSRYVAAA